MRHNPRISATKVGQCIRQKSTKELHVDTIGNIFKEHLLHSPAARKKLLLSDANKVNQMYIYCKWLIALALQKFYPSLELTKSVYVFTKLIFSSLFFTNSYIFGLFDFLYND